MQGLSPRTDVKREERETRVRHELGFAVLGFKKCKLS